MGRKQAFAQVWAVCFPKAEVNECGKTKRPNIYADFIDMMGEEQSIELVGLDSGHDRERFRHKAEQFLKNHESEPVIKEAAIQ